MSFRQSPPVGANRGARSISVAALEQAVHRMVNQVRAENSGFWVGTKAPFEYDPFVADRVARPHSIHQAQTGRFSHTSGLRGMATVRDRMTAVGYTLIPINAPPVTGNPQGFYRLVGENLHWIKSHDLERMSIEEIATWIVKKGPANPGGRRLKSWMESSGHKANLLHQQFTHHGVGIVITPSTMSGMPALEVLATQVLYMKA